MPSTARHNKHGLELLKNEYFAAEFYALYLLLLLLSFLFSYLLTRWRCTYLSEAGATLLVGFVGGGLLQLLVFEDESDKFAEVEVRSVLVSFSGSVLFCVLLPPIVFNSGYHMRGNFFWANIDKITMLAFAGTFVSTLVTGFLLFWAQAWCSPSTEMMTLEEALTFGAMISAIDPVATLAIFEEMQVDPHLNSIVFGESVLNDAVSIVLFHTFAKCIKQNGRPVLTVVILTAFDFLYTFIGSALMGAICGCVSALLFKKVHLQDHSRTHGPHLELAVFLVFSYMPYLLAEGLHLSGTVAILFTGTTMKRYTFPNLSPEAQKFSETMISFLAYIAEAFIFIDLGTSAWHTFHASSALVVTALASCLLARAAHVYPIGAFLNSLPMHYPRRKFQKAELHMVWFSGLRGAIAYALSTQYPGPHRRRVMSLTMAIVLITVWAMGGATVPAVKALGIRRLQGEQLKQLTLTLEPFVNRLRLVHWDRLHIRPFLTRIEAVTSTAPSPSGFSGSSPEVEVLSSSEHDDPVFGSARAFDGLQASFVHMQRQGCDRSSGGVSAGSRSDEDDEGPGDFLLQEALRQPKAHVGAAEAGAAAGSAPVPPLPG